MKLKLTFVAVFSAFFLYFNLSTEDSKLGIALEQSKCNRSELEKVLTHYSDLKDTLKYRAACFLIENMPGHYTIHGDRIDHCRWRIRKDQNLSFYQKRLYDLALEFYMSNDEHLTKEYDIETISADFLIKHIDKTFQLAHANGTLKLIDFDTFLKTILPYRISHETLELWRDSIEIDLEGMKDLHPTDIKNLRKQIKIINKGSTDDLFLANLLGSYVLGDCFYHAMKEFFEARVKCIPLYLDFIPYYSNRNGYHYWCTLPDSNPNELKKNISFDRKSAKVYRWTYHRTNSQGKVKEGNLPDYLTNPFIEDVTHHYNRTTDICLQKRKINLVNQNAYLCVFNNRKWQPICVGEIGKDSIYFKNLAQENVYLPIAYDKKSQAVILDYPFILHADGKIQSLIPDTQSRNSVTVSRKYHDERKVIQKYIKGLEGCIVKGSRHKNFIGADSLFILKDNGSMVLQGKEISNDETYRWLKFTKKGLMFPAELYLFTDSSKRIIPYDASFNKKIFDGNPLTYQMERNEFIIDLGDNYHLDDIICLPRSDGNNIYPENVYELQYMSLEGWQTLGVQEGKDFSVTYRDCPSNALYWLKNKTRGNEERIFTYQNKEQVFW